MVAASHLPYGKATMACTLSLAAHSPVRRVVLLRIVMILCLCRPMTSFQCTALNSVSRRIQPRHAKVVPYSFASVSACRPLSSSSSSSSSQETEVPETSTLESPSRTVADSPWTDPALHERRKELQENSNSRQRNKHNR
jgi:hypothetical protein